MFASPDGESPVRPQHSSTDPRSPVGRRTELLSSVHQNPYHLITPTPTKDMFLRDAYDDYATFSKENFPTASLDKEAWSEDQIRDRHLCIHERAHKPNHQCSYSCPYSTTTFRMDLPQSTPQDNTVLNYKQMDLSDISSNFPDIKMTTSAMTSLISRIFLNAWITCNTKPGLHKHYLLIYLK